MIGKLEYVKYTVIPPGTCSTALLQGKLIYFGEI